MIAAIENAVYNILEGHNVFQIIDLLLESTNKDKQKAIDAVVAAMRSATGSAPAKSTTTKPTSPGGLPGVPSGKGRSLGRGRQFVMQARRTGKCGNCKRFIKQGDWIGPGQRWRGRAGQSISRWDCAACLAKNTTDARRQQCW